jgi:hypothetical protein
MRQAVKEIQAVYGDKFLIGTMSMQGVVMEDEEPTAGFLQRAPKLLKESLGINLLSAPRNWEEFAYLFSKDSKLFDRPVILFIDEFDSLPLTVIDKLVTLFRDIYLNRKSYLLHGLALIGVRAVLGVGSQKGSPFNVQRALHVPNLTKEETKSLFYQYQQESGQKIEPEVVQKIYDSTKGQPGLVSWFGELLVEKYNPGVNKIIDMASWNLVWVKARFKEPNNTVLNLIAKAKMPEYRDFLMGIFSESDIPFAFHEPICNYLYLNGIIDSVVGVDSKGDTKEFCRFSSPFVQDCIYSALGMEMQRSMPILPLDPLDDLADALDGPKLNLPALLNRYQDYLKRLKAGGFQLCENQPLRVDLRIREAIGHFHLYAWLYNALGRECTVTPEFPTGNGQVDLHIWCAGKRGIIETKSFTSLRDLKFSKKQASAYASSLGLDSVTLAVFITDASDEVIQKITSDEMIEGVQVNLKAIGL